MRKFLAEQKVVLKDGLIFLSIFAGLYYLFTFISGFGVKLIFPFYKKWYLDLPLSLAVLLFTGYILGLLLRIQRIRNFINGLLERLPVVSSVLELFKFFDKLKTLGNCEVEFEESSGNGRWTIGWVSDQWQEGEMDWCSVGRPIQAFPGGFVNKIAKKELHFTGRSALQSLLTCLSGGLYPYPRFKKNSNCICERCRT